LRRRIFLADSVGAAHHQGDPGNGKRPRAMPKLAEGERRRAVVAIERHSSSSGGSSSQRGTPPQYGRTALTRMNTSSMSTCASRSLFQK
jgi:hypothetical protein